MKTSGKTYKGRSGGGNCFIAVVLYNDGLSEIQSCSVPVPRLNAAMFVGTLAMLLSDVFGLGPFVSLLYTDG